MHSTSPAPSPRQKTVALRPSLYARIRQLAASEHRTLAGTIEHAIAALEAQQ